MHIPTMMATTITEDNYDLIAALFPNGFLNYPKSEVLDKKVIINEPKLDTKIGPRARYQGVDGDADDVRRRPGVTRTIPPMLTFDNSWLSKKKFRQMYKHSGPANALGFRPVELRDN